ncbi:zinc finger SWIM domain protein [Halosimplex carlsbadense 2-9-1]|uniref:Zinc finger SWIM domain protein n=1 Tax=Halosimplex carlsbadense 2-9-1 TaxID=797114 RepID=M0CER6_9EURY|nr:SWIM zinc finger family protein [Halosimplex carlsbadense]ELZ20857.1 zinc finger SWIM domain protein [Halosimplex carlsbadense 2-9-1]
MHPLEHLDFPTRVAKRAQYEAFEFTLTDGGVVVRNGSHPDPSEHEYRVSVADGVPMACECPADERYEGACKHRVAVAIRRPILDAVAATDRPLAADGGSVTSSTTCSASPNEDARSEDEAEPPTDADECAECFDEFPCWECVRTGRKELPR